MTTRNCLKKTIYLQAAFLCILFIGDASVSLGYQPTSSIHSEYAEKISLVNRDYTRISYFGPSVGWVKKVGCPMPTQSPRPKPLIMIKKVTASWYGLGHHNKLTAGRQRFDMHKNTLAHRTLPLGTKVRLINPDNGKSAEGVVNDRGPYIKGRDVDISYAMANQLGFIKRGVMKLHMEKIRTSLDQERNTVYASKDVKTTKIFPTISSRIPNNGEQVVRYYGYYNNVSLIKRYKELSDKSIPYILEPQRNKAIFWQNREWQIQQTYEFDPLLCLIGKEKIRGINFIEYHEVIWDILNHMGPWMETEGPPPKACTSPIQGYAADILRLQIHSDISNCGSPGYT